MKTHFDDKWRKLDVRFSKDGKHVYIAENIDIDGYYIAIDLSNNLKYLMNSEELGEDK